ncbi:CAP domain-containing protein [Astrocystis sublimbata]|nr:CAP domain-containing protein [Astrocystis sublimbata]
MKSSIILAATGAALAFASPLDKRVLETEVVVEYYTVTVTGDAAQATPTPTHAKAQHHHKPAQEQPQKQTTVVNKPAPEPTTVEQPVVYVTVTPEPEPKPTTHTPEPIPEPETETQPAPEPSTVIVPPAKAKTQTVDDTPAKATNQAASEGDSMQSAALYHHNIHRSNHSSPAMSWNEEIATYAGTTAGTCVFAHDMDQGKGGYGQNIALWGVSSGAEKLGAAGAVKMATTNMWYDGEFNSFLPDYYGKATPDMGNFEAWGHLSQLVWADSTTVGCAVQFCPKGTAYDNLDAWFTVCNYHPAGNVGGYYAKNIAKPKGDASVIV